MKKVIFIFFCIFSVVQSNAQNRDHTLVSKLETNVHILGVGISYELLLVDQLSIQANVNYDMSLFSNSDNINTLSSLVFNIEPRYYYNYKKRNRTQKNTKWNAANFISVNVGYHPDVLSSVNMKQDVSVNKQISIAPMWNLRRNISNSNFNYEVGAGLSFNTIHYNGIKRENTTGLALNLKVGYNF